WDTTAGGPPLLLVVRLDRVDQKGLEVQRSPRHSTIVRAIDIVAGDRGAGISPLEQPARLDINETQVRKRAHAVPGQIHGDLDELLPGDAAVDSARDHSCANGRRRVL